ncbi:MAG: DUF1501 domain-containing protein [Pirellulales bacterium]|nr:DUF1501 domain-containing protein [Pirellulales bacterium]
MLTLSGPIVRGRCDGVRRRDMLKIGLLGFSGLSLADVLRSKAAANTAGRPSNGKSVILYWLDGGPSHMETYDPKPDAPAEFRGPFSAIETTAPGIRVNELLTHQARVMDRVSVIRSVHHDNGDHFAAAHWMLTGYLGSNSQNLDPQYPSAGSIITKLRGPNRPGMPAYVAVPHSMTVGLRPGYNSGAFLGASYDPFETGGDPNADNFSVPNLNLPGEMPLGRLENRGQLLASLDRVEREADRSGLMQSLDAFNQAAFSMLTGDTARVAFDISREPAEVRERYGRNSFGQSALLARRLVEAGVTFVTIHNGGWDHHWDLEGGLKNRFPAMDQSIGTLIADLSERGMLDDVVVVVMGEFGRTPRLNNGGNGGPPLSMGTPGRDHWGNAMSVLMGGGGLNGGIAVGATNSRGEFPAERPIKPADILATLYHVLGIDATGHFVNRSGRPVPVNNSGEVIAELV